MFCIRPTAETNNIGLPQFGKLHGSMFKVLNLNLVVVGLGEHILAEQIVTVCLMNMLFQDTVPWEQRQAYAHCVGSRGPTTGREMLGRFYMDQSNQGMKGLISTEELIPQYFIFILCYLLQNIVWTQSIIYITIIWQGNQTRSF